MHLQFAAAFTINRSLQGIITMSTRALVTLFAVSLLALGACSREKSDWRSAQAADSSSHTNSSSRLTRTARSWPPRASGLQQLAEDKDWRAAAATDTAAAYEQFLAQYPPASGPTKREYASRISRPLRRRRAARQEPSQRPPPSGEGAALPDAIQSPSATAGGYGVQLGAFSSAERANEEWQKLKTDAAGMLDGLAPRVVVVSHGKNAVSPAGRRTRRSTGTCDLRRSQGFEKTVCSADPSSVSA
jgi:hypothetical protein